MAASVVAVGGLLQGIASAAVGATPGALDPSFGSGGLFIDQLAPPSSSGSVLNGVAVQSDGTVVVAGSAGDASGDREIVVARLNPNRTLDTSLDVHRRPVDADSACRRRPQVTGREGRHLNLLEWG